MTPARLTTASPGRPLPGSAPRHALARHSAANPASQCSITPSTRVVSAVYNPGLQRTHHAFNSTLAG